MKSNFELIESNKIKFYIDLPHLQHHMNFLQKQNEHTLNLNRVKNIKQESDLENKRSLIKLKIKEKKDEINSNIKSICEIEKELSDLNIDLELQNIYGKNSNVIKQIADIEKSQKNFNKKKMKKIFGCRVLKLSNLRVIKNIYLINFFPLFMMNNFKLLFI